MGLFIVRCRGQIGLLLQFLPDGPSPQAVIVFAGGVLEVAQLEELTVIQVNFGSVGVAASTFIDATDPYNNQ